MSSSKKTIVSFILSSELNIFDLQVTTRYWINGVSLHKAVDIAFPNQLMYPSFGRIMNGGLAPMRHTQRRLLSPSHVHGLYIHPRF